MNIKNVIRPLGPSYQYARSVLAYKIAMDNARERNADKFPSQQQVINAMKGLRFKSFVDEIHFARGDGHQAVHAISYGVTKYNKAKGEPGIEKLSNLCCFLYLSTSWC